ncbi:MAG: deoxyribonucleoside 5'-monophosphate N-glycosidase [Chloroflexi bacterium]|nr:deoxyribonucleoside 5'-monophosphate N-glycosidase [Chloroflexota bacterium]
MKIYFACSITGGRDDEAVYQAIVDALLEDGHEVPTAHIAKPEVISLEHVVEPEEVFTRDVDWINNSNALIAEVSTPSHGVGYEIAYALSISKPVLCCYKKGAKVSKMITGNTHAQLTVRAYTDLDNAQSVARNFISQLTS